MQNKVHGGVAFRIQETHPSKIDALGTKKHPFRRVRMLQCRQPKRGAEKGRDTNKVKLIMAVHHAITVLRKPAHSRREDAESVQITINIPTWILMVRNTTCSPLPI